MLKGISLKSVKRYNTHLVLQAIYKNDSISRIQIAEKCSLSPSAVTSIVGELIKKGILEETGTGKSTGGRKPVFVRFSSEYSVIIFEVLHSGVGAYIYNFHHEQVDYISLSPKLLTGNELFLAISFLLDDLLVKTQECQKISRIGILYQDNVLENEFSVMYSTSVSSENISLETALTSKYKIPVKKELSERLSLSNYFSHPSDITTKNFALVHIGEKITVSVTADGTPVNICGRTSFDLGAYTDITEIRRHLLTQGINIVHRPSTGSAPSAHFSIGPITEFVEDICSNPAEYLEKIYIRFANLIQSIQVFFPIELVLLSGKIFNASALIVNLQRIIGTTPTILLADAPRKNTAAPSLAGKLIEESLVVLADSKSLIF